MSWGIIAGQGLLPLEVARGMRNEGIAPVILCLAENVELFRQEGFTAGEETLGQLAAILRFLLDHQVDRLVLAGRVGKEALLSGKGLDQELMNLFAKLEQKNDDALQLAVVRYFEEHGIKVEAQTRFLTHLIPQEGLLAGPPLSEQEKQDLRLGFMMAKEVGRLDIGQSVVVKKGMVLAVEAAEGTDQTILRAGRLGGAGNVVVKVAKPKQDLRFDLPAVGMTTLEALINSQARVLGIQADATFILDKVKFLEEAERHGISVVAIDDLTSIDK
ncbi:MAG: LpxI family protein [Firmicutes bacterium]|nr:LpxI family protein [Bacillota bacterium]